MPFISGDEFPTRWYKYHQWEIRQRKGMMQRHVPVPSTVSRMLFTHIQSLTICMYKHIVTVARTGLPYPSPTTTPVTRSEGGRRPFVVYAGELAPIGLLVLVVLFVCEFPIG